MQKFSARLLVLTQLFVASALEQEQRPKIVLSPATVNTEFSQMLGVTRGSPN